MQFRDILVVKMGFHRGISILALFFATFIVILSQASECEALTLTITEKHGSVTATPDKADYDIGEVVELVPRPDTGYYFSGWAGDAHGKRLVLELTMDGDKNIIANFDTWQPPIGIPEPPFGITTTHMMYADSSYTYDYGSGPEPYRIGPDGPYTHYIDPDHPNATNTNNPYGTVDIPRISLPPNFGGLPPGSVVEIHGDGYGGDHFTGSGTIDAPIFFRGASNDPFTQEGLGGYFVEGSYYVFENIKFDWNQGTNPRMYFGAYGNSITHVAVRNSEVYNGLSVPNQSYQAFRARINDGSANLVQNLVFYNNSFHDIGEERDVAVKRDAVGISIDTNVKNVWILDNEFYRIGGDGIQVAWDSYASGTDIPQYIYIGRNIAHDNYENFLDLKMTRDVIVSQNIAYNFGVGYTSVGGDTSIPYRYGLGEGPDDVPRQNIWTLFNIAFNYNSPDGGFSSFTGQGETLADEIYYIGNIAYNSHNSAGTSTGFFSSGQEKVYWINNIAYNCDRAGYFIGDNVGDAPTEKLTLINNIFGDIASGSTVPYNLMIGAVQESLDRMVIKNNVFYNSGGDAQFRVGVYNPPAYANWSTYSTYSAFRAAYPGFCTNSMESNPDHVNAANGDFRLQASSTAIDAGTSSGVVQEVFDRFQALYGIDIRKDIEGVSRPQGAAWDIGAYEYADGSSSLPRGDVTGDGVVNIQDILGCVGVILGTETDSGRIARSDLNGDSAVNIVDLLAIVQIILS